MIFILIISSAERRYPGLHNPGYQTPTEEVRVHDVHFDNITFMGNKCETWQDMRLVTELANDIYVNGVRTCRQMKF